jgi:hypothetical protein
MPRLNLNAHAGAPVKPTKKLTLIQAGIRHQLSYPAPFSNISTIKQIDEFKNQISTSPV